MRSGGFPDLGLWSYLLLVVLAATEGPLSVLLGAAAAAAGYMRADWVYFSAVTGNLIGDTVWYLVGYANKPDRIMRIGRRLRMHPEHVTKLEVAMRDHAAKLILMAKLSISLMIPTLIAAGLARVPWRRWFPVVFVIELVWTAMLVWVGYHATGIIARFEHSLHVIGVIVIILLLVGIVWYVNRMIRREEEEVEAKLPFTPPAESPASPTAPTHPTPSAPRNATQGNASQGKATPDPRRLQFTWGNEKLK